MDKILNKAAVRFHTQTIGTSQHKARAGWYRADETLHKASAACRVADRGRGKFDRVPDQDSEDKMALFYTPFFSLFLNDKYLHCCFLLCKSKYLYCLVHFSLWKKRENDCAKLTK